MHFIIVSKYGNEIESFWKKKNNYEMYLIAKPLNCNQLLNVESD